jgi:iron complex transport system ATP-binding protein
MTPALLLKDAVVRRGSVPVLDGVSLEARAGEVLGVVGANGSGKTSLLKAALGLARLSAGHAELASRDLRTLSEAERARLAGYLPQERHVGWNMTAWRVASLGAFHARPPEARARAEAALDRVGLLALKDRGVLDMSGGERARVLLARLLATEAPLLIADEPIAGLDPDAQLLALDLLREEAARGRAIVLTLHDLPLAARYCDRLAVLAAGRLVAEGPPADALTPEILAQAFALDGRLALTPDGAMLAVKRRGGLP